MLVFLHGRGDDADTYADESLLEVLDDLGDRRRRSSPSPTAAATPTGTIAPTATGARYVMDEVIPQVAALGGGDRDRVAIGGISMGGFGAYDLAAPVPGPLLRGRRALTCAVAHRGGDGAGARSTTPRTSPATT